MPAPLGEPQLIEMAGTLLFGGASLVSLLMLAGVAAYLFLCAGSSRQWDGSEKRWRRF